jgi:hypothetical protein
VGEPRRRRRRLPQRHRDTEVRRRKRRRNIWRGITWIKGVHGLKTNQFSSFFLIHAIL